ncbi:MAG: hypothetical protein IKZ95_06110 [Lachnospiraceae bacterium]|nr:hypothetical protein [Lachnospiraceae bacterium]
MNDVLEKALQLGQNKKIATEEFLVATGEKDAASFSVAPEMVAVSNITENTVVKLDMKVVNEGYFEIEATVPDSFITLGKRIITSDDFVGGVYYFPITIVENRLHAGRNYSQVTLRSSTQEFVIPVMVNIKVRSALDDYNPRKKTSALMHYYLDYKRGLMDPYDWMEKSNEIIGDESGNDRNSMFLMLYQAQMFILLEQYTNAANILEFMAEQIAKLPNTDYELVCYFYYVECLYERDEHQIEEAARRVRAAYQINPSWRILWVLINLDENYGKQQGLKLDSLLDCFEQGCFSPIMYLEALEVFRRSPQYLCDASDFELQVLHFGAKVDYVNANLCSRFAELILESEENALRKINLTAAVRVLKMMYERFKTRNILMAVCRLLVLADNREKENHPYYAEALREYVDNIPDLFRYYLESIDEDQYDLIPTRTMELVFADPVEYEAYLPYFYANMISNKEHYPDYYKASVGAMVSFAEKKIAHGADSRHMVVIYRDILENHLLTYEIQRGLFEILATKEIVCRSSRMTNVLVIHNELNVYQDVLLTNGKCLVKVYSGSAIILFRDARGNIYANIDHEKRELINQKEYIDLCIKGVPLDDYMLMEDTLPLTRAYKDPVEILHYLANHLKGSGFRISYIQKLLNDTVLYFSKNSRTEEVYDELIGFFKFDLAPETRGKLIDIMIERSLYKDAYDEIEKGGFEYVDPNSIAKLSKVLVEVSNYEQDDLLLAMCEQSFTKTTFDKEIFQYLLKYYNDKLEVMMDLYRAGNAYGIEEDTLPERILRRTIDSHDNSELIPQLFAKYYEKGTDEALKKDYLNDRASRYFYNSDEKNTDFFKYIENGMSSGEHYSLITEISYLKYMSDKDLSSTKRLNMIEEKLKTLCSRSIMLEEFKQFKRYFELPSSLANSVIITSFGHRGMVQYRISSAYGETVEKTENMNEIVDGFFAKYITLFYGEMVTYSVDGAEPVTVRYEDLDIVHDESRYSNIDNLIRLEREGNTEELNLLARDYFVKSELIDRLF